MYKKYLRLSGCIIILLLVIGCSLPGPGLANQTATPDAQTIAANHRPYRVIQICIDTPPLYPAATFTKAANKVADWIDKSVTVNQDGFDVYVGEIKSTSFQVNVIAPIKVPPIPADEKQPTPQPDYTPQAGENGYHATDMQATITAANEQAHTKWQKQVTQNHATLATTQQSIKEKTDALRHLDPNVDLGNKGADVFGCLADASQHFQGTQGDHYLIIASAFINNTTVNEDPNLKLANAHIRGIYRDCTRAPDCAEKDTQWRSTLTHLGANSDIKFYDPLQSDSLTDPLF